ncbi:MAG: hypothetical protein C3F02_00400 [Parcubacteria group bacterium]|nr:MAG: hypothetical protein C3F02_00400 [Parcubacteria group bacterium]
MKKILIFSYSLAQTTETALRETCSRLPDFDFYLITDRFDKNSPKQGKLGPINVYFVGNGSRIDKYMFTWRAIAMAANLHKAIKFDFAWCLDTLSSGLATLLFRNRSKVPYLLTEQSTATSEELKKKIQLWGFYFKRIYRKAKCIQVVNKFLGQRCRKFGAKAEIFLIPSGMDQSIFQPRLTTEEKINFRRELGIEPDDLVLISCGDLNQTNGQADLIKALNFIIYKSGLPAVLILVGDGAGAMKLSQLAADFSVGDYVLLAGQQEPGEVARYLEIADIFIKPTTIPTLGRSFLESMAMGVPTIGPSIGSLSDFIIEGETGLFCQLKHPASIALAVEKYVHDHELYRKVKEQAQRLVREKYNCDVIARKIGLIFQEKMI